MIELCVKYQLKNEFRSRVESEKDCKITNVIELKICEIIMYTIDCPKDKEETVKDYGFMTWIRNPEFQKYYSESEAFKEISAKWQKAQTNHERAS